MKSKEYQEKKNSEYWEKRIANSTWKQYNSLEERNKKLLEFYIDASESIKDELYTLAEKYSKDGVLSRTEMHKQNRLQKLNQNFEKIIEDLGHKVETFAKENMQQGFENVNENIATKMGEIDFAMPNKNLMEKLFEEEWRGDSFSGRLWKNQRKLARGLNSILLVGLQQGKTATEMAIQLHNFMGKGFNECHRLVRTETMHYLNSATLQRYKNANVEYVQIWAAADERTCTTCGGYHTKTYPIEKAPILPLHANCRCTYLPVTDKEMIAQQESKMDFMGQPNIFQNNQIRVKGYKVDGTDNIYTQTNTSNAKKGRYEQVAVEVDKATGDIVAIHSNLSGKTGSAWKEIGENAEKMAQKEDAAFELIAGSHMKYDESSKKVIDSATGIEYALEDVKKTTDGTRTGIIDLNGTPYKIEVKKDGTIKALGEISSAADEAAKGRTLRINVVSNAAQKIGGAGANAILNAANGFRKFNGIDNVPYDGYQAVLHKNERVLTAEENKAYTANQDKTDYNTIRSIIRSELKGITIELNDREMGRAYSRYAKERRSI